MLPAIAFPYHNPDSQMDPHLQDSLPDLKTNFGRAFICPQYPLCLETKR